MDQRETGKLIAKLRKEAGYTQKSLADALFITDKAVSKWERGLCLPDSSLLTRLSMLLDTDIDMIVSGKNPYGSHNWTGELHIPDPKGELAGKPIIHYLLSYFMLAGITDIYIDTEDRDYIRGLQLENYGLNISFIKSDSEKVMTVDGKFLLFGVNLTRQLRFCMDQSLDIVFTLDSRIIPIVFSHRKNRLSDGRSIGPTPKILGRGTVYIPLEDKKGLSDAGSFIGIYEKYHKKIADLTELAKNRHLTE